MALAGNSSAGRVLAVSAGKDRPHNVPELIRVDDVDDAIGIAIEWAKAEADTVSVAQLVEIGAEVGLPAPAMLEAAATLEEQKRAALERAAQRKRYAAALLAGLVFSVVLLVSIAAIGRSSLVEQRVEVDGKRARVASVIARRNDMLTNLEGADLASEERWAEISGSENRISVEKRRYDEAATEYNRRAATFSGSLGASLFGHPKHIELSDEIGAW